MLINPAPYVTVETGGNVTTYVLVVTIETGY